MTKVRSVCRTRNSPVWEFSHIAKDTSSQYSTLRPTNLPSPRHHCDWFLWTDEQVKIPGIDGLPAPVGDQGRVLKVNPVAFVARIE